MKLDFAAEQSPFKYRCMYLHPIDWKLTHLTADTWTLDEWKLYLDLIQAAGANMLKTTLWPTQYYHPDYPQTHHNRWRWEVLRNALAYAGTLGLETHLAFAGIAVPPFVWLANPDKRAEEVDYTGIELCWRRGREEILEFSGQIIDTFADTVDGFVVWYADPGLCVCPLCRPYTPVIQDMMSAYEERVGSRAQVHHCPWWIWWMETGEDGKGVPRSPGIRREIFGGMRRGDWTLVYDRDEESIRVAKENGLDVLSFAFFLDRESGNESHNILPRTFFDRIEQAVRRADELGVGLLAYRLTPFTQFHSDWLFFRRMLEPDRPRRDILESLAAFLGVDGRYVEALEALDRWWEGPKTAAELETLRAAARGLREVAPDRPEYLAHVSAATDVLLLLAEHGAVSGWQVSEEVLDTVQAQMEQGSTFTSFTHEQLWDRMRARPFIRQRLEWWLTAMAPR